MDAAFASLAIDWAYLNCEVAPDGLAAAVAGARAMGWRGFNCSLPHKERVIAHLDGLSRSAELIGAVNCVVNDGGRLVGHNTDGVGFVQAFEGVAGPLAGRSLHVVGAGGAARAIAFECALAGVRSITITNRSADRAAALAAAVLAGTGVGASSGDVDVVVNATSVGMLPAADALPPVDLTLVGPGVVAADVVASPPRTAFLAHAEAAGAICVDGLGMLVEQAARNLSLWSGLEADRAVLRAALLAASYDQGYGEFETGCRSPVAKRS
jgi:shikimate dehydrogenase